MHRAGTWMGSDSFVFAIRREQYLLRSSKELRNQIGLTVQILLWIDSSSTPSPNAFL
jgi:hypothetical protein